MQRKASTANAIRTRQTRAFHRSGYPFVETLALIPEMIVPMRFFGRLVRAVLVQEIARFRNNGNALFREFSQSIHGFLHEIGVFDNLVIVNKDHGIETENSGNHQSQIADGAISHQANAFAILGQAQLLHALVHQRLLGRANNQALHARVLRRNRLYLVGRLLFHRAIACN